MRDNFRNTKEDDVNCYKEFVPGQPWMSREQRKRKDLDTTMDEIEVSISKHKTDAFLIVYDILKQATTFEREGRDLAQEIQKALEDDAKEESRKNRNRRQKESLKTQSVQNDQIEESYNRALEEAFKEINMKMQKYEEKKEVFDSKKEAFDNKTEDLNDIGSYGSTMFRL